MRLSFFNFAFWAYNLQGVQSLQNHFPRCSHLISRPSKIYFFNELLKGWY